VQHAVGVRCRNRDTREARFKVEIGRGFYTHVALAGLGKKAKARMSKRLADDRRRAIWFITQDKTDIDCIRAGDWLLECVKELDAFDYVESVAVKDQNGFDRLDGYLIVKPKWQKEVDRLREECIWNDPVLQPLLEPPPPWTSLHRYIGPLRKTFIKNLSPKERKTIAEDFRTGVIAEHARGVSALERTALSIDEDILDLVQRHAVDIIGHKGEQPEADEAMVKDDVTVARMYAGKRFHLSYTCDRRGRIYADQYLNFARQDHVRAVFRFAKGDKLGEDNVRWLQIHVANCHGEVAKKSYQERVQWCLVNHDLIQRVAAEPDSTIAEWREVDAPFAFVAACKELVRAYPDPDNFETHLPISLDGTANAIQHSALILRDENAAKWVNLTPSDHPQDVYREVVERVLTDLRIEATEPADCALADLIDRACFADWWLRRLDLLRVCPDTLGRITKFSKHEPN
jgi:DNA-directed RNA polymerase